MKLIEEDYQNNKWTFVLLFDECRELKCEYIPKKDEADWNWSNGYGSIKEIGEAKKYLVNEKIIPRIKLG